MAHGSSSAQCAGCGRGVFVVIMNCPPRNHDESSRDAQLLHPRENCKVRVWYTGESAMRVIILGLPEKFYRHTDEKHGGTAMTCETENSPTFPVSTPPVDSPYLPPSPAPEKQAESSVKQIKRELKADVQTVQEVKKKKKNVYQGKREVALMQTEHKDLSPAGKTRSASAKPRCNGCYCAAKQFKIPFDGHTPHGSCFQCTECKLEFSIDHPPAACMACIKARLEHNLKQFDSFRCECEAQSWKYVRGFYWKPEFEHDAKLGVIRLLPDPSAQ